MADGGGTDDASDGALNCGGLELERMIGNGMEERKMLADINSRR